jgi:tRNA (guanine-N7-)-methyltransferase
MVSMYANSRRITSSQNSIHDQLSKRVARHAASRFLKPIAAYSEAAFESSIDAWRKAEQPPLILDAGCGTGASTLYLAKQFPTHFVIGVDQSADRLARGASRSDPLPANFVTVRADLVDYWRLMLRAEIYPDRHYLLYPNPWSKKRHIGRRWHAHPVFPTIVSLGGYFECRSNWRIYIDECAAALTQLTGGNVSCESYLPSITETGAASAHVSLSAISPFEAKYLASGHSLWRCSITFTCPQHGTRNKRC